MTKRRNSETSDWSALMQEARDSFSTELVGLFFVLAGAAALFSLRGVLPEWSAWPIRAAGIGVLAALMFRNGHVKAWSFRPQPERRSLHR